MKAGLAAATVDDLILAPSGITPPGQLFDKNGYKIAPAGLPEIDRETVKHIIECGFTQELKPAYFDDKKEAMFLVEQGKRGVTILLGNYLDILAVDKQYQSNGIGKALMEISLDVTSNRLFWRSRTDRLLINIYYSRIAEQHQSTPHQFTSDDGIAYNGYALGLNSQEIWLAFDYMRQKPSNFLLQNRILFNLRDIFIY